MADLIDECQRELEFRLSLQLRVHLKKRTNNSVEQCVMCGETIPTKRRELLQGVKTCVHCQQHAEKQSRHYRKGA